MKEATPVLTAGLFPELLDNLINILSGIADDDWHKPTPCPGWSVKDLTTHLYGDEVNILARGRDAFSYSGDPIRSWEELVRFINWQNDLWVQANKRLSPPLLLDLLRHTGDQVSAYFASLDMYEIGAPVEWASPDPAPVWMGIAREYTERWHHQQQICEALSLPDLLQPRLFKPVLDSFIRAFPYAYRQVIAPEGTAINFHITGEAGSSWSSVRTGHKWKLYEEAAANPVAEVSLPQKTAWQLFTRIVTPEEVEDIAQIKGDKTLGLLALQTVSIIV
jgi:uncharacterized protein (TIGR03083 family)